MNNEALKALKKHSQSAADAFQRLQAGHDGLPHEQLDFNYAVLLALKAAHDALAAPE